LTSVLLSPERASAKRAVPERAIVPRFSTSSSRLMPMPLSSMVSVPAALSGVSMIFNSAPSPIRLSSAMAA